jgi:hypothetical protein
VRRHFSELVTLVMLIGALLSPSFYAAKVEAAAQVSIVSTNGYFDPSSAHYHVLGEVQNSGDTALEDVKISAIFYTSNGTVIGTSFSMSWVEVLLVGRKSPFKITLWDPTPLEVDHYSLNVTYVPTTPPPIGLEILWHSSHINETEGTRYLYIVGEVKNIGSEPTWHIHVIATYYDETGNIMDVANSIHHARSELDAGQKTQFSVATWGEKIETVASYKLTVESIHYSEKKDTKDTEFDFYLVLLLFLLTITFAFFFLKRILAK